MAKTAKPISTITYNTKGFLLRMLDGLRSSKKISDYRVIFHYGEMDKETGEVAKDHWHVWIEPNRQIDTMDIEEMFVEQDPTNDKPLRCQKIRNSDEGHWLMYVLHDAEYLRNHQSDNDGDGKIPYTLEDIITPHRDDLERTYKKSLHLRKTANQEVIERLMAHQSATQIIYETGINPVQVKAILGMITRDGLEWKEADDKRIREEQTEDLPY